MARSAQAPSFATEIAQSLRQHLSVTKGAMIRELEAGSAWLNSEDVKRCRLRRWILRPDESNSATCREPWMLEPETKGGAQLLARIVDYRDGNRGAMLRMIRLARDPRYLHENQITIIPLCTDYKIAMVSQ